MRNEVPLHEKQYYTSEELRELGLSYYLVRQYQKLGKLRRISRKCYASTSYQGGTSDFVMASAYVPEGVICLMSAAVYYGLIVYRPDRVDMAVSRSARISTMPEKDLIRLHYFEQKRLTAGVEIFEENHQKMHIYNMDKTVADMISFRNRIGIEETREILVNYLNRKDRNINQLYRYADQLRCLEILEKYMEMLV